MTVIPNIPDRIRAKRASALLRTFADAIDANPDDDGRILLVMVDGEGKPVTVHPSDMTDSEVDRLLGKEPKR